MVRGGFELCRSDLVVEDVRVIHYVSKAGLPRKLEHKTLLLKKTVEVGIGVPGLGFRV